MNAHVVSAIGVTALTVAVRELRAGYACTSGANDAGP